MFSISKYARGLPDLLGLKERGSGPRDFSEQVVGTVNMTELYLLQNRETILSGNNAAPIVGSNFFAAPNDLLVPANELWYCWHYSVSSTPGAGAAIDMAPILLGDGSANSVNLGFYIAAAATQQARTFMTYPFWAGPGSQLGFTVRSVTLAPTVNANLVFTRLRV